MSCNIDLEPEVDVHVGGQACRLGVAVYWSGSHFAMQGRLVDQTWGTYDDLVANGGMLLNVEGKFDMGYRRSDLYALVYYRTSDETKVGSGDLFGRARSAEGLEDEEMILEDYQQWYANNTVRTSGMQLTTHASTSAEMDVLHASGMRGGADEMPMTYYGVEDE
jgi:hypothetical protein